MIWYAIKKLYTPVISLVGLGGSAWYYWDDDTLSAIYVLVMVCIFLSQDIRTNQKS
jgi:hypothetical protein